MTEDEFKKIVACDTSKEVWETQRPTSEFETISFIDNETFTEFHSKQKDIVNSLHNLNKIIHEHRVVKKILRFLLDQVIPKITVI